MEKLKPFLKDDVDMTEVEAVVRELQEEGTNSYLGGLDKDKAAELLQKNKALSSAHDTLFSKGLETWKEKTLPGLVDEEYKKRNPPESEGDKRIRALEDKLAQAEQKEQRVAQLELLRSKAAGIRKEKGINISERQLKRYVGQNDEETAANFSELVEDFSSGVNSGVDAEIKKRFPGGNQPKSGPKDGKLTYNDMINMPDDEIAQLDPNAISQAVAEAAGSKKQE